MGCGASSAAGASEAKPKAANKATDKFATDITEFVLQLVLDDTYAETLLEKLLGDEELENEVEKLLRMLLSVVKTVAGVTAPKHEMPEFLMGCMVAFLVQLATSPDRPEKAVELSVLQETGYHIDAKFADAVYGKEKAEEPEAALVETLAKEPNPKKIEKEDVIFYKPDSDLCKPAHAVILDRERSLILVVVRGTANWKDMIADAAGESKSWQDGYAHDSVATSAEYIFSTHRETLLKLKAENPTFHVRCVGHSLGGGVAGCLSLLMHHDDEFAEAIYGGVPRPGKKSKGSYLISAACFGSAAVLSKELTEEVHPYCTTFVHEADLVPRLCTNNISDFIVLADNLVDVFKAVMEVVKKLMAGETPEGYDDFAVMSLISKAASSPGELIKELMDQKLDTAEDAVAAAADADETRLYAPGRLVFLARPEAGVGKYSIFKGSMAGGASKLLLKGSMLKDHSMTGYATVVCTGEGAEEAA